jgi:hypothetical protein
LFIVFRTHDFRGSWGLKYPIPHRKVLLKATLSH